MADSILRKAQIPYKAFALIIPCGAQRSAIHKNAEAPACGLAALDEFNVGTA